MKVLSLFDGMSCGQIALERVGIPVKKYYASEIDKYAIKVAQHNYPNTIQLGDVRDIKGSDYDVDLVMGGSPCQGFSFAGKQLNFDDPRSKLFFEYVRLLEEIKPTFFLLENVNMDWRSKSLINRRLGVNAVTINSSLFSAQDRERLYWTNIDFNRLLPHSNLTVEDILESEVDDKYVIHPNRSIVILEKELKRRKIAYIGINSQGYCIYNVHGKSICLCANSGGLGAKTGIYALPCLSPDRLNKRQNGRRFKPPGSKFYTLTAQDKHGVLTNNFIRKLTPIEAERLQTVPDDYTACCTDTQRLTMLGNGWTVDVIAHILSSIPNKN
jgi:DNA-cytosine methyltransferase